MISIALLGFLAGSVAASIILAGLILIILLASLKVVYQYQRGVVFTLGRYTGTRKPGLQIIVPILQRMQKVDIRLFVNDVPSQDTITLDNVTVRVNAVLYYKVFNAEMAVIKIQDVDFAVSQLAQTTMRNVVGQVALDTLLSQRDEISEKIREIVDKASDPWGVKVTSVDLKHIELPEDMKRVMAKAAEAERIRRAVIIRSEGDALAAKKVAMAAELISKQEGALHLRTLQAIGDMASDPSNIVHMVVPLDIVSAYEGYAKKPREGGP